MSTPYQGSSPAPGDPLSSDLGGGAHAVSSGGSTTSHPDVENESLGSIVSRVSSDLSTLMRQELALAKAELTEEAKTAGKGAGMLAGAGVAGWMAILFLSMTLMWALGNAMDLTWAALIVTVLWAVVAGVLAIQGRNTLKQVNPKPEATVQSLKEDAQWLKAQKN